MAVQAYTITSAAPIQPASNSYTLAVDNPKVKIKGVKTSMVDVRLAMDGSDPDATDSVIVVDQDSYFQLTAKTGEKVVFAGLNMVSGNNITVEIQSS